jgi:protein TonB
MNANQILSADLLDLIFTDRNKAYGAYELRKSYDSRIKKALGITSLVLLLGIGGHLMARSVTNNRPVTIVEKHVIELSDIPEDIPEPPPLPPSVETPPPVRMVPLASPVITPDELVEEPPATQEDLKVAIAGITATDGVDYSGIVEPPAIDGNKVSLNNRCIRMRYGPDLYSWKPFSKATGLDFSNVTSMEMFL